MNFDNEQLMRIAKVIDQEDVFKLVFKKNLIGGITDADVIRHVEYYEEHGVLYGYTPSTLKTKVRRSKRKTTKPTRKSKTKKKDPPQELSVALRLLLGKNGWLKKDHLLSEERSHELGDGLIRTRRLYRFPDGTVLTETLLGDELIQQSVEQPVTPVGYPFISKEMLYK